MRYVEHYASGKNGYINPNKRNYYFMQTTNVFNSVFQSITGLKRLIDKAHRMQISNVNSSAENGENDYFFFSTHFLLTKRQSN